MQPELEDREQDAQHEAGPQVLHLRHAHDGQLAEDGEHVVVQQRVAEDLDLGRLLVSCHGAVAKSEGKEGMRKRGWLGKSRKGGHACPPRAAAHVSPMQPFMHAHLCATGGRTSCLFFIMMLCRALACPSLSLPFSLAAEGSAAEEEESGSSRMAGAGAVGSSSAVSPGLRGAWERREGR